MTKTDLPPLPKRVPTKRAQLRRLADVHIAMWLDSSTIMPDERDRLLKEREDRRRRANTTHRVVGVLVGQEGVTPQQLAGIRDVLAELQPTELHHPLRVSRALQTMFRTLRVPCISHREMRDVIRSSRHIVAAPREPVEPLHKAGVWGWVKYAKQHRSLIEVTVIAPDGTNLGRGGGS